MINIGIKITNCHFENNGTGIHAEGKIDMELSRTTFKNNDKDMEFIVDETSHITIDDILSTGCKTESISIKEYSTAINDIELFVKSSPKFSLVETEKYIKLLEKLNSAKDSPSLIKKILNEIYGVGKGTTTGLLLAYIKMKMHW